MFESAIGGEEGKTAAETIKKRREFLERELEKFLGVNVRDDVLPHVGDKVVMYQSPTEGLSIFGTVVCVSLKDPAKIKSVADRINRGLETIASAPIKVRKKVLLGVEMRELHSRGFAILTPTYAFVDDWIVVSMHPQAVQGSSFARRGGLRREAGPATAGAETAEDGCACSSAGGIDRAEPLRHRSAHRRAVSLAATQTNDYDHRRGPHPQRPRVSKHSSRTSR